MSRAWCGRGRRLGLCKWGRAGLALSSPLPRCSAVVAVVGWCRILLFVFSAFPLPPASFSAHPCTYLCQLLDLQNASHSLILVFFHTSLLTIQSEVMHPSASRRASWRMPRLPPLPLLFNLLTPGGLCQFAARCPPASTPLLNPHSCALCILLTLSLPSFTCLPSALLCSPLYSPPAVPRFFFASTCVPVMITALQLQESCGFQASKRGCKGGRTRKHKRQCCALSGYALPRPSAATTAASAGGNGSCRQAQAGLCHHS